MSCWGSNAGKEMSASLISAVVSNALFHSNHASIRFCLKSSTSWAFSGRLAAPYFETNVLRSGLLSGQKSGSSSLLHYWTGNSE